MKLYAARIITCDVQNCVQELKIPCAVEEGEGSASRNKQREEQREIATFCYIIHEFSIFLCCFLQ